MNGYDILALIIFCITIIALVNPQHNKVVANKAIMAISDALKVLARHS